MLGISSGYFLALNRIVTETVKIIKAIRKNSIKKYELALLYHFLFFFIKTSQNNIYEICFQKKSATDYHSINTLGS